eukprot:s1610_g9.t1
MNLPEPLMPPAPWSSLVAPTALHSADRWAGVGKALTVGCHRSLKPLEDGELLAKRASEDPSWTGTERFGRTV